MDLMTCGADETPGQDRTVCLPDKDCFMGNPLQCITLPGGLDGDLGGDLGGDMGDMGGMGDFGGDMGDEPDE